MTEEPLSVIDSAPAEAFEIDAFCRLVQTGMECWYEAGKMLCKILQKDGEVFSKITARIPFLTADILEAFRRIGQRQLYPPLLIDSCPANKRLSRFKYEDQTRLYGKPIRLAYLTASGETASCEVPPQRLTNRDADLVFAATRMRSVDEQAQILKARKPQKRRSSTNDSPKSTTENPVECAKRHFQEAIKALVYARSALELVGKPLPDHFSSIEESIQKFRNLSSALPK